MSQENVEVARAVFEAWNRGDMDAVRDLHHPDVITHPPEGWPEAGPFVGREAVMREFEQLREAWDADYIELVSALDVADRVVVEYVWHGRGQGPESRIQNTAVFTVREGRVSGAEFFWDRADALEAAGLSE